MTTPKKPVKRGKKKKKQQKKSFFKRLFGGAKTVVFAVNKYTTRTDERTTVREVRLFGRKITFMGFMALAFVLIFIIVLAMNDRSVGVDSESVIVTGLPEDFEGYRILHISDMAGRNFGQDQTALMRIIKSVKYDAVVLTGDMIGKSGNSKPFLSLLTELGTSKPVYFIAGDSDPSPLVNEPRDYSAGDLTLRQIVLADWVLEAEKLGAVYVDTPVKLTKGNSGMWLMPDYLLNLNVEDSYRAYKDEFEQQTDSSWRGVVSSKKALPFTDYRHTILKKSEALISQISTQDVILMLSHDVPTDSQILVSQDAMTAQELKSYFPSPDLILAGHYCGGEWKIPGVGAFYIPANMLARYGWFPQQEYVEGQRRVGSTIVYVTPGLSVSGDTLFSFRLMNPPQISLITLTGELPNSFLG